MKRYMVFGWVACLLTMLSMGAVVFAQDGFAGLNGYAFGVLFTTTWAMALRAAA